MNSARWTYPNLPLLKSASVALASGSPRRKELLGRLLDPAGFQIIAADLDESRRPGENPVDYVTRLALSKAEEGARKWSELAPYPAAGARLVIAADTSVVMGQDVYGKPEDATAAARMLRELAGRTHRVLTGVAVRHIGPDGQLIRQEHEVCSTEVDIKPLSTAEIEWYVATGEPLDKAGAYAVQGFGGTLVAALRGDYYNVVGLPLVPLIELLGRFS